MIYQFDKRLYAIGMDWSLCEDMARAKSTVRTEKRQFVTAPVENGIALGLLDAGDDGKGLLSGALAIGTIEPNCIIYHEVSADTVWFVVIHGGVTLSGLDRLVPLDQAHDLLREHMAYTNTIVGSPAGAKASVDETLRMVEQQLSDGRISKVQFNAIRLQQPASSTKLVLQATLVMTLVMACGVAWWGYQRYLNSDKARRATLAQISQTKAEQERLEAERKRRIQQFNADLAKKRAEMEAGLRGPLAQWQVWERIRKSLPLTVNGYVPDSMECTPQKCVVSWHADGPSVRIEDRAAIPGWVESLEPSLEAKSEYALPAADAGVTARGEADAARTRLRIAQLLQFAADGSSVGAPAQVVLTPPPPPPETGLAPVTLGSMGDLRLVVTGEIALLKASQAIAMLSRQPVGLKALRLTQLASGTPGVDIEGYWVFLDGK